MTAGFEMLRVAARPRTVWGLRRQVDGEQQRQLPRREIGPGTLDIPGQHLGPQTECLLRRQSRCHDPPICRETGSVHGFVTIVKKRANLRHFRASRHRGNPLMTVANHQKLHVKLAIRI